MMTHLRNACLPGAVTFGAAVLLLLSPAVLGFAGTAAASAYILAALLAVIGVRTFASPVAWEGWIIGVAGVLVVAMPWILSFATIAPAFWSHVVLGLIVMAAGFWALWIGRRAQEEGETGEVRVFERQDDGTVGT